MKKYYYYILILWLSIKWIFRINLGDQVLYNNKKYIVINGVRSKSWRLNKLDNGDDGWVKRKECKKVVSIKNYTNSFKSGYKFYMTNWYQIWTNSGIKDWMKKCKIW